MGARTEGLFFLVAGPTASGKTTVLKQLVDTERDLKKDVSVTTRPPREGETDGCDYHFWTRERFLEAEVQGAFLETAVVHQNHHYGTLKEHVTEQLKNGIDVIKDIDVQGVGQIRKQWPYPRSVAIFVTPPSAQELIERLRRRGSEDEATLKRRLDTMRAEVERIGEYDYMVVNDSVETAVRKLVAIRTAEHCRRERHQETFTQEWRS